MHKARLTISRPSCASGKEVISLEIKDDSSGLQVIKIDIPLNTFAKIVTGQSELSADVSQFISKDNFYKLGKEKEVKSVCVYLPKEPPFYTKEGQALLKGLINNSIPDGWLMWSDGMSSQQNTNGKHKFSVCRYV